jgi:cytochrome c553
MTLPGSACLLIDTKMMPILDISTQQIAAHQVLTPKCLFGISSGSFKLIRSALTVMVALGSVALAQAESAAPQGSVQAGAQKNAMCIGCHGIIDYKTGFPDVHRVPKLYGQNAKYIAAALAEYKQGDRKHPSMRAVAQTLSDQDMADLGAYFESISTHASASAAATPAADTSAAKALVEKGGCPACHGANFNKPIDPSFPKLAGQHGDYLFYALKAYQTTDKALVGRGNPIMVGMVKQFTSQELQTLARYLEGLGGDLTTVQRSRFR